MFSHKNFDGLYKKWISAYIKRFQALRKEKSPKMGKYRNKTGRSLYLEKNKKKWKE